MNSKKVVVNFASVGREDYLSGQLRLMKSCINAGWTGDFLFRALDGYCDNYMGHTILLGSQPVMEKYGHSSPHKEVPFQFKVNMIQEAREKGYEQIVWCDASVTMEKDITPLLDYAKEYGVCAVDNLNFPLHAWLSDAAQEKLGISNDDLWTIPQLMACMVCIDTTNPVGIQVLDEWMEGSRDGVSFMDEYASRRPGFVHTRWDQSYLSGVLWKHNIPLLPYGKLVYEPFDVTKEYGHDIYFVNRQIAPR